MCPLASWKAEQASLCDTLEPGSWQSTKHPEAVAQVFGDNASKRLCLCAICAKQAMHLRVLANRESEQIAPRDALVFGRWQCITCAAKCNIEQFALSGLVHPHSDAWVQTVLPRSCIYVSPCPLEGGTSCTMRCFGVWVLEMHHVRS